MTEQQPRIGITVDGSPVLTVSQAAARHDRTAPVMRNLLRRHSVPQVARLDTLPLYAVTAVDAAVAAMPGRGANLRRQVRQARVLAAAGRPPADHVPYGERKPYIVADNLDDLRGPTSGKISLPRHLDWSGSPHYNLDNPGTIASVYQTVLSEAASVADLNTWLDRDTLLRMWPTFWLPAPIRRIWKEKFPELPEFNPAAD